MTLRKFKAAALSVLLVSMPAAAQENGPLHLLSLSGDLFDVGVSQGDPLAMLVAARLRKQVHTKTGSLAPAEGTQAASTDWQDWETMLATALATAPGNVTIADLAEDIRAESSRGNIASPARSGGEVRGGETNIYRNVSFEGGEYAEIYVEGSGTTDIDLLVHDASGVLVCSDSDASDRVYCGWVPDQTRAYDISIINKGNASNRYSIMTN